MKPHGKRAVRENDLGNRTIQDFGEQWTAYQDNSGFYGSVGLLADVLGPLMEVGEVAGSRVADVGAGTGRFVRILITQARASHVIALEPSAAFSVLQENTEDLADRVTYLNVAGDQLAANAELDFVFSYGVLHHIPEPDAVIRRAWLALRPGGRCIVWLYGREGNGLYLFLLKSLLRVTRRLPHAALVALVWILYGPLYLYMRLSHYCALPLGGYMREVLARLTPQKRRLVIYDQLNPSFAKYYTQQEARDLLAHGGFVDVKLHHRHGYSWTVIGTKPGRAS